MALEGDVHHPFALVCMSDTHGLHRTIDFDADLRERGCTDPSRTLIVFSGDCCRWPDVREGITDFSDWMAHGTPFLSQVPRDHKLAVDGNHDEGWDRFISREELGFTMLDNRAVTVTVGGTAVNVFGWSYFRPNVAVLPLHCDVVLSHAPARRVDRMRNELFVNAIVSLLPASHLVRRVHVSGHAHERYFVDDHDQTTMWVGAAMLRNGEHRNHPLRKPIVVFPDVRR